MLDEIKEILRSVLADKDWYLNHETPVSVQTIVEARALVGNAIKKLEQVSEVENGKK